MTRPSWLCVVALATACSTKKSAPQPATKDATTASTSFTPVAISQLAGWTFRSADEGWWSAAGDEQLFVSHVDLGHLTTNKSDAERAHLVAGVYREVSRRMGGAALAVDTDVLTAQLGFPVACITGVNAKEHVHTFSCGLALAGGPTLGIEYTSYRDDALDVFDARARALVATAALAAAAATAATTTQR